ncbi:hypothetical protein QUA81_01645 [Microcoleus sp. F6_B4]
MKLPQKLLTRIDQFPDDKLAIVLSLALLLKTRKESVPPLLASQAYQDWLSAENDIYDAIFAD